MTLRLLYNFFNLLFIGIGNLKQTTHTNKLRLKDTEKCRSKKLYNNSLSLLFNFADKSQFAYVCMSVLS